MPNILELHSFTELSHGTTRTSTQQYRSTTRGAHVVNNTRKRHCMRVVIYKNITPTPHPRPTQPLATAFMVSLSYTITRQLCVADQWLASHRILNLFRTDSKIILQLMLIGVFAAGVGGVRKIKTD